MPDGSVAATDGGGGVWVGHGGATRLSLQARRVDGHPGQAGQHQDQGAGA